MVGLRQQHDDRGYRAIGVFEHVDRAIRDQRRVIVEHRPGRLADTFDVHAVSVTDDPLDHGAILGLGTTDHGSGNSMTSPSWPGSTPSGNSALSSR